MRMNKVKADVFRRKLINLLYEYNISFEEFLNMLKEPDVVKYLGGLEKYREELRKLNKLFWKFTNYDYETYRINWKK